MWLFVCFICWSYFKGGNLVLCPRHFTATYLKGLISMFISEIHLQITHEASWEVSILWLPVRNFVALERIFSWCCGSFIDPHWKWQLTLPNSSAILRRYVDFTAGGGHFALTVSLDVKSGMSFIPREIFLVLLLIHPKYFLKLNSSTVWRIYTHTCMHTQRSFQNIWIFQDRRNTPSLVCNNYYAYWAFRHRKENIRINYILGVLLLLSCDEKSLHSYSVPITSAQIWHY